MPKWRNWQTRRIQNPVPVKGVWVRVPSSVLERYESRMKIGVIIPAAGQSNRFGSRDKLSEDLGGRPLLIRTVEFFTKREDVLEIVVAGPPDEFEAFQDRYHQNDYIKQIPYHLLKQTPGYQ